MTHSGGKPHGVGDRGQRYEVSFFNPDNDCREVFGWSNDKAGAEAMAAAIDAHPVWHLPEVKDREVKS